MKKDYTHITVIVDRSGSMESIRDDTVGGFNAFLKQQKAGPGTATLTLVQFDSQDAYEVVHDFKPIEEVPELNRETYVPRSGTPLLDALGRGINDLEARISGLKEEDHPEKVIVAVVTDGQENSSREFRKAQIEKMIKEKTEKDQWQFAFLSSDLQGISDARALGIRADAVLPFEKSAKGTAAAWTSLSEQTSLSRSAPKRKIGFDLPHPKRVIDPKKPKA